MVKKIIIIFIIIVSFVLGFFLGYFTPSGKVLNSGMSGNDTKIIQENELQNGPGTMGKGLEGSGFEPTNGGLVEGGMIYVSGVVKEIKNKEVIFEIQSIPGLNLNIKTIDVSDAKFYKLTKKDQEQFRKEMEEFGKKMEGPVAEPLPIPELFTKEEITFSDIYVGQQMDVLVDEGIESVERAKAIEIITQFVQ